MTTAPPTIPNATFASAICDVSAVEAFFLDHGNTNVIQAVLENRVFERLWQKYGNVSDVVSLE